MTRVNVIDVKELSDQHLIAEYRELPRCLKQDLDLRDAPVRYCLGKGHMKWAKRYWYYTLVRYNEIRLEMIYRGFKPGYVGKDLVSCSIGISSDIENGKYVVSEEDILLNRNRLIERYLDKPDWYRWTKREKPDWIKNSVLHFG